MSLGAFVQQPQVKPFGGWDALATSQSQYLKNCEKTLPDLPKQAVDTTKIIAANSHPNGFLAGTTQHNVLVTTVENPSGDFDHGDVTVFKRPSGTVGVKQYINGIWKTLFNEDEAKKKFGSVPAAPAPAPAPPVQAPQPLANQVMGIMIFGATTDNALNGRSAENKSVGIVKRESGTVGVKQMLNGKWETLYTEAEAIKKFGKTGGNMKMDQGVMCANCTEVVGFDEMVKGSDGYYYCCIDCVEEAGTDTL